MQPAARSHAGRLFVHTARPDSIRACIESATGVLGSNARRTSAQAAAQSVTGVHMALRLSACRQQDMRARGGADRGSDTLICRQADVQSRQLRVRPPVCTPHGRQADMQHSRGGTKPESTPARQAGRQADMHELRGEPQADASAPSSPVKLAWEEQELCLHWLVLASCSLLTRSETELSRPWGPPAQLRGAQRPAAIAAGRGLVRTSL